jgi:hypothetical protein
MSTAAKQPLASATVGMRHLKFALTKMSSNATLELNKPSVEAIIDSQYVLVAALRGVRGLAEIEAAAGSNAWRKAIAEIDRALAEAA